MNDLIEATDKPCCEANPPSILKRLATRKQMLEAELANVDAALNVCETHPEIHQALSVFQRALGQRPY